MPSSKLKPKRELAMSMLIGRPAFNSHVETRAFVCEKWLPLWRLIVRQEQPELKKRDAMVRSSSNEQLKLMYRPGRSRRAERGRDRLILALAGLIGLESCDQWGICYNLSMEDAQAVWRSAIDRLLPVATAPSAL